MLEKGAQLPGTSLGWESEAWALGGDSVPSSSNCPSVRFSLLGVGCWGIPVGAPRWLNFPHGRDSCSQDEARPCRSGLRVCPDLLACYTAGAGPLRLPLRRAGVAEHPCWERRSSWLAESPPSRLSEWLLSPVLPEPLHRRRSWGPGRAAAFLSPSPAEGPGQVKCLGS